MARRVEDGLTWVGAPVELFRAVEGVYLDQARHDFPTYLQRTLAASQRFGGRFNAPGEFGALYTAADEDTAWAEVASRFRREGVDGLPPDMGLLRLLVRAGRYADVTTEDGCRAWEVTPAALTADEPDDAQRDACWRLARAVRAVADALLTSSARTGGDTMPLFPDRHDSGLTLELLAAQARAVPERYAQRPGESW